MKFPESTEKAMLRRIKREPDTCLIVAGQPDPLIYRDNLTVRLRRYLWRQVLGELGRYDFLAHTCETEGCLNPHHHEVTDAPMRHRRGTCPNGHEYDPATDLEGKLRCSTCAVERLERRRARRGITQTANKWKTRCPKGHPYTKTNTYLWTSPSGSVHRKCRKCTIERVREARALEATNR